MRAEIMRAEIMRAEMRANKMLQIFVRVKIMQP